MKAPAALCLLDEAYEDTMTFLEDVRSAALKDERRVLVDLRETERITPEIGPLLLAEMQRIKFLRGAAAINGLSPKNAEARRVLHAIGFFKALGMWDPTSIKEGDDLDALFDIETDTTLLGGVSKDLAQKFAAALSLSDDQEVAIEKAFNEALENISEHAYFNPDELAWPAEEGRWWICAMTSPLTGEAIAMACDLGLTIPETLERSTYSKGGTNLAALKDYLLKTVRLTHDERMLGAAFEDGVTRRPDGKGGNGLGKMAHLVQEFPDGHLRVLSGGAIATLATGHDAIRVSKLPLKFSGTYIIWRLTKGSMS